MKFLSYPRSLLGMILYPIVLFSYSAFMIVQNLIFSNRNYDSRVMRSWGQASCWLFGVKIRVEGMENNPPGSCLYLFNHTSFFDIFAMQAALPNLRFGAKIELFKIPIFGRAMTRGGVLPIARDRRDDVLQVYKEAAKRTAHGERFALAPEGTRYEGSSLGRFKAGPFFFAISAQIPIVPVVIVGAKEAMPKNSFVPTWGKWTHEIVLHVLKPVPTEGLGMDAKSQLQELVRGEMQKVLNANETQGEIKAQVGS